METYLWTVPQLEKIGALRRHPYIREAAAALRAGRLVAFPTETVYGLGADATNTEAVANIFTAKGRPGDNPLIVHIGDQSQLAGLVTDIPPLAEQLMQHFWPGPLTLVLPSEGTVSNRVTAGLPTVGVRMPDHPVALALLQEVQRPIAAPSANRSGRPSPTEARHVLDDLDGNIFAVVDGGRTGFGLESTVVDVTGDVPLLLRPGGITLEQLQQGLGGMNVKTAFLHADDGQAPSSPGMKYRHYAPRAKMLLVRGSEGEMVHRIQELTRQYSAEGQKVGVLTTEEHHADYAADVVIACGRRDTLSTVARELYRTLRQFDFEGVDQILCETFPEAGWGMTIMNRLQKAASGRIV